MTSSPDISRGGSGEGPVYGPIDIEHVRQGMRVVDAAGETVGTVEYVQMGDREAAGLRGNEPADTSLLSGLANALTGRGGEPDLPEPLRSQLLREGFVKIDAPGLMEADRYVRASLVRQVSGDTVTLGVTKQALAAES